MAEPDDIDSALSDVNLNRRALIKRMTVGAVAAPVIASFSMSALSADPAYAQSNSS